MQLFPARLAAAVRSSLADHLGRPPKVLAWAPAGDGHLVGLAGRLLVSDGGDWQGFPWHEIEAGRWDEKAGTLSWQDGAGDRHEVALQGRSRFTDLFNERVTASVVASRRVDLGGRRHLTLALRRNLEPGSDETFWRVTPSPGVDLASPDVQAVLDEELAAARADFGFA